TLEFLPDPSIRQKTQLFVVPAEGGQATQVTHTKFDVGSIAWSSDNRTIFFTGDERQDENIIGRDQSTAIYAVSRDGGEPKRVTASAGNHAQPSLSPDGTRLAYVHSPKQGEQPGIMVVEVAADGTIRGQATNVTASWDNLPGTPMWTSDGRAIRFGAGIGGDTHLFEVPIQTRRVRQVTSGARHVNNFSTAKDGSIM